MLNDGIIYVWIIETYLCEGSMGFVTGHKVPGRGTEGEGH